jgi:hypothetical protein
VKKRKALFWLAVGGTAILANFVVEVAADNLPSGSFRRFVQYIHRGPGGQEQ